MTVATLAEYEASWRSSPSSLVWSCPFVLPFWLKAVKTHLGSVGQPLILTVSAGSIPIGHLPLSVDGQTAYFLGIADVCDYQDLVARPDNAIPVMAAAADFLKSQGVTRMDLQTLRPDALALQALSALARQDALGMDLISQDVTYEVDLPTQWDDYLMRLGGKQRHEVRRKIRRLASHARFNLRRADSGPDIGREMEVFLNLFHLNRSDKSDFMNPVMSDYFRDLMTGLARQQMLRLYFLDVEDTPAASVLCFDHDGVRYLYNSGYNARFDHLSVGMLSKVLSIQQGIDDRCRRYDLLKGAETYKKRIGGIETVLHRCRVEL